MSGEAIVIQQNLRCLDQMRAYLEQNNAVLSILFIPFAGTYLDDASKKKALVGKEAIAGWAARNQVPFLFIGPEIKTSDPSKILLRDHGHFNVLGNRKIATAIEQNWTKLTSTPAPTQSPKSDSGD